MQGTIFLPIKRASHRSAFVINQEEIVTGAENVIQPKVQPCKRIHVVVLNGDGRQPPVVEIIEQAQIGDVVRKLGLAKGKLVNLIIQFDRKILVYPQSGLELPVDQVTAVIAPFGLVSKGTREPPGGIRRVRIPYKPLLVIARRRHDPSLWPERERFCQPLKP